MSHFFFHHDKCHLNYVCRYRLNRIVLDSREISYCSSLSALCIWKCELPTCGRSHHSCRHHFISQLCVPLSYTIVFSGKLLVVGCLCSSSTKASGTKERGESMRLCFLSCCRLTRLSNNLCCVAMHVKTCIYFLSGNFILS